MGKKTLDREACRNVLVVAITPRRKDRQVDLAGVRQNVRYLIKHGIDFIMPECGTGMVYDASLAEYEAVVGTFIDEAGEDAYIVPGIGPGFGRALEMGQIARSLGVDGVMIMPIVGPASANGVYNGLKEITENVQLPTILYQRRLDIMPVENVVRLCELDSVVGLKYAADNLKAFDVIVEGAGDQAAVICGMAEEPCIEYMAHGAIGFSSGMANFVPRMSLTLHRKFTAGDKAEAQRLRDVMIPFENFRGENSAKYSSSALHAAMDYVGLAGGPAIPFAEDVAPKDLPQVQAMVDVLMKSHCQLIEN
ncbi:dihydrodipicolinate synthase family protein [Candidatus Poribacteria bacterium]|nr:dihydrodipicolinate synthase family protein [Candidatus Poribacteria bacterium]